VPVRRFIFVHLWGKTWVKPPSTLPSLGKVHPKPNAFSVVEEGEKKRVGLLQGQKIIVVAQGTGDLT